MKFNLNKFAILFLLGVIILAIGQVRNVSAQLTGGGSQASGLEGSVSGTLKGKVGTSIFKRLSQPSTKKSATRKKSGTSAGTKTRKKTSTVKKQKTPVRTNPVEVDDDEDYEENYAVLNYIPVPGLNTAEKLANSFSQDPSERKVMIELFKVVKVAYDQEAAKKGKKNDVALALTFFIATCVTVYNDVPEPEDAAFDNLYETLADVLVEDGEFTKADDSLKQETSETLIFISGLVLGGYMNGKENSDQNTVNIFRTLAGISLQSLTQIDPGKMSFDRNGLVIRP